MYKRIGLMWIVKYCMATVMPLSWAAKWRPPERGCEGGIIAKRLQRDNVKNQSKTLTSAAGEKA